MEAILLDDRTLTELNQVDLSRLIDIRIIDLTHETTDSGHERWVSRWERIRRPADEANTSSDVVPTPPGDQTDPIPSTGGDGSPALTALAEYVDSLTEIPQPEDASPPVASSPPSDLPLTGSEGRAAETTIRCTVCRGRGETLWVEQTWALVNVPSIELEECGNCVGSGYELVQIDEEAS